MPYQVLEGAKMPIKVFVANLADVDSGALDQLRKTANLPWVESVAAMPDVHFGLGATVGSVLICREAVSPAVVGVDIGCGMMAVKTPYNANDLKDLPTLRHSIERSVPVGFNANKTVTPRVASLFRALGELSEHAKKYEEKATHQLGTLGGGNHFIEICIDELDGVWVMLHSGSRHIGKSLAEAHIGTAKGLMGEMVRRFGSTFDAELACLAMGTAEYHAYLSDLDYCQKYARFNREEMMMRVLKDLSYHMHGEDRGPEALTKMRVNCHHNYIEFASDSRGPKLITRKGAVSARRGELGIIPGSMGTKSYIVRGRGSEESFCSCSHGAGRKMSRGAAKRAFTISDVQTQTAGVECRKDDGIRDELPGAYKSIDQVMANQSDLVDIEATLRALICVKG